MKQLFAIILLVAVLASPVGLRALDPDVPVVEVQSYRATGDRWQIPPCYRGDCLPTDYKVDPCEFGGGDGCLEGKKDTRFRVDPCEFDPARPECLPGKKP